MCETLNAKTILITGGTGSFGREFVRKALQDHNPKRLIVFSRDELKQHEMRQQFPDPVLGFFIGDVRDRDRLYRAFKAGIDVVIHAAALKQVPACEYNPYEAVKTNVLGSQNVIDAAIDCGIPRVIALSTDKAVNPVNIYGASKLCAEKLFVHGNSYAGGKVTRFSCVRYGNVFGSRGSVLPKFLEQRRSGRITVTDPRMTRFWISLDDAVDFVTSSIELMRGGEVFIPKIPSMPILEMVLALAPDAQLEFTGIRSGEKLHETLIATEEARHVIALADRYVILPENPSWGVGDQVQGRSVPEGFSYTSDTNPQRLEGSELLRIIKERSPAWEGSLQPEMGEEYHIDPL